MFGVLVVCEGRNLCCCRREEERKSGKSRERKHIKHWERAGADLLSALVGLGAQVICRYRKAVLLIGYTAHRIFVAAKSMAVSPALTHG